MACPRQSLRILGFWIVLNTLVLPAYSGGSTLVSNLPADENTSYGVNASGNRLAQSWNSDFETRISHIVLPLSALGGGTGAKLTLQSDTNGHPSGVVLDQFIPYNDSLPDTLEGIPFLSLNPPNLPANKTYWLVLTSDDTVNWHVSTSSDSNTLLKAMLYTDGAWTALNADLGLAAYTADAPDNPTYSDEAIDYTITLNGELYDDASWDASTGEIDLNLFKGELSPGYYQLSVVITYADGFKSAPVTHHFQVEPGPQHYLLSHHINDTQSEADDGFVLTDNPVDTVTRTVGKGLPPGPYTLVLESYTSNTLGYFPTFNSFYTEPDNQHSTPAPTAPPTLELLDENNNVVGSYGMYSGIDQLSYESYLSASNLKNLPIDTTLQVAIRYPNPQSVAPISVISQTALYRQETYNFWINRLTNNYFIPELDQDNDGLSNLLEWYLKTDPLTPNLGVVPAIRGVPEGLEISWIGRGGSQLNSDGQMYFDSISDHFGIDYLQNADLVNPNWLNGFPFFESSDNIYGHETATNEYTIQREPLANGLERIRYTLLITAPNFLEAPLFIRWSPSQD